MLVLQVYRRGDEESYRQELAEAIAVQATEPPPPLCSTDSYVGSAGMCRGGGGGQATEPPPPLCSTDSYVGAAGMCRGGGGGGRPPSHPRLWRMQVLTHRGGAEGWRGVQGAAGTYAQGGAEGWREGFREQQLCTGWEGEGERVCVGGQYGFTLGPCA